MQRNEEIVRRAKAGESFQDIGDDLGLSRVHVGRIAHRAGLPKRTRGEHHHAWKNGRKDMGRGYVGVLKPDHPRATGNGYVLEHLLVAEEALGRPVPRSAEVHHVNGDRTDNRPANLVICEDHEYHMLIEYRSRALDESGNANFMRCYFCGFWDDPDALYVHQGKTQRHSYHRACKAAAYQQRVRRAS